MRIVILSPGISKSEDYIGGQLGGIECQILGLAKKFVELGNDVFLIRKWSNRDGGDYIDGVRLIDISTRFKFDQDIRIAPLRSLTSRFVYSKIAVSKILEIKPEVIIMNELFSSFFVSRLNIPKIFVIHIPPYKLMCSHRKNIMILTDIINKIEKFVLHRSDRIITLNKHQYMYLSNTYPGKITFISNAVDIKKYHNESENKYILYGGRLVREKGVSILIRAYSEINRDLRNIYKLLIIGSGPEENYLKQYAHDLHLGDDINFIPWLTNSEFLEYLSRCSIFVLPSLFECMPVSILEAMASAKPVIASDIPGSKDIIIHRVNGFLFKSGQYLELKHYLELLLENEDLRMQFGSNARNAVEEKFNFDATSIIYLDLLKQLDAPCVVGQASRCIL